MSGKRNWVGWLVSNFKEFISEFQAKSAYEVMDIYECVETGVMKAVIKFSGRHISEKNISNIVNDLNFLKQFDTKAVRTFTYMATIASLKPDYSIAVQQLGNEVDDYILEIRAKSGKKVTAKSPIEMSKDKSILSKFSPVDANRIGYLAGVKETVKEFKLKQTERVLNE
jgi:hypothetical protein